MASNISLKVFNRILLCAILICVILYYARAVLIPLTFSVFFAMLFAPMANKMEKHGINRPITSLIAIMVIAITAAGIGLLVFLQSRSLVEDLPQVEEKLTDLANDAQAFISHRFNIPAREQKEMITKQLQAGNGSFTKIAAGLVGGIGSLLASVVLVLIFTFLLLYQREKYETFFVKLCRNTPEHESRKLFSEISRVSQQYLTGRALSIGIFTLLFTVGFLIVGLKNAFLLAFIAALLTIVPYVGSIVGGLFPFVVALATEDSFQVALGALAVVLIIQGIDNYFIEPYIIGGEINISAFFTILILFVGGLLWQVAGMILFLPMLGVTRIIFDHVPGLRIYAYLVGDQKEGKPTDRLKTALKKLIRKFKPGKAKT